MFKNKPFQILFFILFVIITANAALANQADDKFIEEIYQKLPKNLSETQKIDYFSRAFMGKPYLAGPLGEGKNGLIDQSPLYRTDGFDCQTYVETVLALSQSKTLKQFKKQMNALRYEKDAPSYLTRNHFLTLDWIKNNHKKGLIKDMTPTIIHKSTRPVFQLSKTVIKKRGWLKKKTLKDIKIKEAHLKPQRLEALHLAANSYPDRLSTLAYIPLTALFDNTQKANAFIFNQIPSGSIITIVRPNWPLEKFIGTDLDVSHLGFTIKKNNILYFREASSIEKKVIDIPLASYLKNYINSPTIKGINVLIPILKARAPR